LKGEEKEFEGREGGREGGGEFVIYA